ALEHAIDDPLDGNRTQRCLRRRFPDTYVAANRCEEGIPGPDRDGEVKSADDANESEGMPLLVHAVLRALGMHRRAIEHARLPDREVRDVDHLLYFAIAFRFDLAGLERHERAERIFVLTKLVADETHGFA